MGGYIGQCLALVSPSLMLSLFITGAAPPAGSRLFMARWPLFAYFYMLSSLFLVLSWLYRYGTAQMGLNLSEELVTEMRSNVTWELVQDMFSCFQSFSFTHVRELQVPVLSIAGAKGDDVPTMSLVAGALRGRKDCQDQMLADDGSAAIVIREATHGCDMQFPELFAKGLSAWASEGGLPEEFEKV